MTTLEEPDETERAEPSPLDEPPEAGLDSALDALDDALAALRTARRVLQATRVLRLDAEAEELSSLASGIGRIRDSVTDTGEAIAARNPIARSFRHGDLPWYETGWGPRLTPRQFWALAKRAVDVLPSELVIYADIMRKEYPSWAFEQEQRAEAWADGAAARVREMKRRRRVDELLLQDVESRPCTKCGAGEGECCITRGGNPGGPHTARKALSPLKNDFQRELSELGGIDHRARYQRPSGGRDTDRHRLGRFITSIANSLALGSDGEADPPHLPKKLPD